MMFQQYWQIYFGFTFFSVKEKDIEVIKVEKTTFDSSGTNSLFMVVEQKVIQCQLSKSLELNIR